MRETNTCANLNRDCSTQYTFFNSIHAVSSDELWSWGNIKSLTHRPYEKINDKLNIPCIAANACKRKTKNEVVKHNQMTLLWVDIDDGSVSKDSIIAILANLWVFSYVMYTTWRSTPLDPRWRVLIEISTPITPPDWLRLQQALALTLNGDTCAAKITQIFFLPCKRDDYYEHHVNEGNALDVSNLNDTFQALIDRAKLDLAIKSQPQPRLDGNSAGIINLVNAAYCIEDILLKYNYTKVGDRWLHPNSKSGIAGVIILSGNKYYSHHSNQSDSLANGYSHDCFDLLVYWKYNNDVNAALTSLANELDSKVQKERQVSYMQSRDDDNLLGFTGVNIEPDIIPLNTELPPVKVFDYDLLPDKLSDWIRDIAERIQCPPDFLAVGAMVGIAGLVGRKRSIHPKAFDDWIVTPNLWGALVGRPSIMKTPALNEVLKPLNRLIKQAQEEFKQLSAKAEAQSFVINARKQQAEKDLTKASLSKGKDCLIDLAIAEKEYADLTQQAQELKPVAEKRYIVNDATVEALGERLNENPNGLILVRDELIGWLRRLDREDNSNERAFYLESFNGSGSYTYDRIGRGTIKIENTCISVIGGIQPSKLAPYVANSISMGSADDGLIQRLQLAVYPDDVKDWVNVDRYPNSMAKNKAFDVYESLANLDEHEPLRFDSNAQEVFNAWRADLEAKLRADDIHPAIESHLAKYRSLIPSIALLLSIVDEPNAESIESRFLNKAIKWGVYLFSHSLRIYNGCIDASSIAAKRIVKDKNKIPSPFKAKEIQQKGWSGLNTHSLVKDALNILVEHCYLIEMSKPTNGRPSVSYRWNKNIESP